MTQQDARDSPARTFLRPGDQFPPTVAIPTHPPIRSRHFQRAALVFPQRSDMLWPTLEFIQANERDSQEIEDHLADLFSLGPQLLEARQQSGVLVWRNLVSFVLVDLGYSKYDAIKRLGTLFRPRGGTMGRYRVTEQGSKMTQEDL